MSEQVKNRTRKFALDVMTFCGAFPRRFETQHVVAQLLRSSSSVAANYRAAFRGRSRSEFSAKLGIVVEEADESQFWVEILRDAANLLKIPLKAELTREMDRLIQEAEELLRIAVASQKTARSNL